MITLACTDFAAALAALEKLGLRVDMIMPADAPHVAQLSNGDVRIRLEGPPAPASDGAWHDGRAGMQYRDLLPDRFGGRMIASHIRVPGGGPVPDYVHYHELRFQMIYCHRGWVRLVYEDQGEPFVMRAGECVVQPPAIRHRVLECSPGLEVIELASPATHATFADHGLALPNGTRERSFAGQRFFHGPPGDAIAAATSGVAQARLRSDTGGNFGVGVVLRGAVTADGVRREVGDAFKSGALADATPDLEWLEVTLA